MFLTSAGSTAGSSGGMYFDQQSGAAIGLHIGWVCDTADGHSRYDPASCFNYGLRFDRETVALAPLAINCSRAACSGWNRYCSATLSI